MSANKKTGMLVLLNVLFMSVNGMYVLGRVYVVQTIMGPCWVCSLTDRKCLNVWFVKNSCFMCDLMRMATPSYCSYSDCLHV